MKRRDILVALLALGAVPTGVFGQQARVYRIGVIHHGGVYLTAVDGLRDGLKALGFEEGKHYVLHLRDAKGDLKAAEPIARSLENEKVDVIFSMSTSVSAIVKRATKSVPIVFYAGSDPVRAGLVEKFSAPGGRVTGVYSRFTDLAAKRLELLQVLAPNLRRVVAFYNTESQIARRAIEETRAAARQLKLELVERPVASVEELKAGVQALRPGEVDAFAYMTDSMIVSQSDMIIEAARARKMLTMFADRSLVAKGGLASYGESYFRIGRQSAGLVHKVLRGTDPGKLAVEQLDQLHFVINLKTAKELGLTIPDSVLTRADEVIR
jgi:putative ABC transport system substrate-binding protein